MYDPLQLIPFKIKYFGDARDGSEVFIESGVNSSKLTLHRIQHGRHVSMKTLYQNLSKPVHIFYAELCILRRGF
jgi:hypothetical protein